MSCEPYLDLISARLDGPLSPDEDAALSAHLNLCPHCRAIARDLGGMHTALTGCVVPPPVQLATGVMGAIRTRRTARRRTLRQLGTLAACLVLCAGLFTLTRKPQPSISGESSDTPSLARHVQPFALTDGLTFSNEQRLRLNGSSTSFVPTADLLGNTEDVSRFIARFPYDNLSAVAQTYDEEYFRTHRLLAVVVCEPSSSISHTISALTEDRVAILRDVPEAGGTDVALWLILAEVDGTGPETTLSVELLDN